MKSFLGAVVAGLLGAGAWTLVSVLLSLELGFLAWGVGIAVGAGVHLASNGTRSTGRGVMAAFVAIGAILAGKFAAAVFEGNRYVDEALAHISDEEAHQEIAYGILASDASLHGGNVAEESMAEAMALAQRDWATMTASDQQAYKDQMIAQRRAHEGVARGLATGIAFVSSFGLFDVLWAFLAIGSSYKLGATGRDGTPAGVAGGVSCGARGTPAPAISAEAQSMAGVPGLPGMPGPQGSSPAFMARAVLPAGAPGAPGAPGTTSPAGTPFLGRASLTPI